MRWSRMRSRAASELRDDLFRCRPAVLRANGFEYVAFQIGHTIFTVGKFLLTKIFRGEFRNSSGPNTGSINRLMLLIFPAQCRTNSFSRPRVKVKPFSKRRVIVLRLLKLLPSSIFACFAKSFACFAFK